MNKKIITIFFMMLLLASCDKSKEQPVEEQAMTLVSDTKVLEQVAYANESESSSLQPIVFKTKGSWHTMVKENLTKANTEVTWLRLSKTSGEQGGEHTIVVYLDDNYTGASRSAVIEIISADQTIKIVIKQESVTKTGEELRKLVSKIKTITKHIGDDGSQMEFSQITTFEYDKKNRPVKITFANFNDQSKDRYDETLDFKYVTNQKLHITLNYVITEYDRDGNLITDAGNDRCRKKIKDQVEFIAYLNDDGYITKFDTPLKYAGSYPTCYNLTYNEFSFNYIDGFLSNIAIKYDNKIEHKNENELYNTKHDISLIYDNDRLISINTNYYESTNVDSHYTDKIPSDNYSTISNTTLNYDLNEYYLFSFYALNTRLLSNLRGLGFIGKRSMTLINQMGPLDKEVEFNPPFEIGQWVTYYSRDSHVNPGDALLIHPLWHSYSLSDGKLVYETDSDGTIFQKTTQRIDIKQLYNLYGKIGEPWTTENAPDQGLVGCYPLLYQKSEKQKEIRYTVKTTTTYETQTPNSSQN